MLSSKKKNNILVFYVFDLVHFQYKFLDRNSTYTIKNECDDLNYSDYCIVASKQEKELLESNGFSKKIFVLEMLDYDCIPIFDINKEYNNSIAFCGFLPRSTFLKQVSEEMLGVYKIKCFGEPLNGLDDNQSLKYVGNFKTNDLISKMSKNSFGLVWDGDSCESMIDFYGGYSKYIIPHKCCSYIASGLPLIVWSDSAIADFVKKNQIGLTINKVSDLKLTLSNVTDEQYKNYLININKIQKLMSKNFYINKVIESIIEDVQRNDNTNC